MDSMKSGPLAGGPVARSLRITGATNIMVGSLAAAVALNGMIGIEVLRIGGQAVLLAVIFASLVFASSAVCIDILGRSGQAMSNLRSIGATRSNVSSALLMSIIMYGGIGSVIGALAGAGVGPALVGVSFGPGVFAEAAEVVVASAAALGAGVYLGGRYAWNR
jgi:hypothetical protein